MADGESDLSDDDFVNIEMDPQNIKPKTVNGLVTVDLSNYDIISNFPNFPNNIQVVRMCTSALKDIPGQKSKIPDDFCQMLCLKELFLFGDAARGDSVGLSCLPKHFGNLRSLEVLNLEHNNFSEFPEEICDLVGLKKLYLNGCGLTSISPRINNLLNLLEADLSDNNFSSGLCKELFDLPRLKDLYLMNCSLSTLPEEIGNLKVLQGLRLMENMLTEFPEQLYTMKHLKKLSAPKNRISKLSPKVIGLESLTVLVLAENNLMSLPDEISKLPFLQVLDVCKNKLTCLPESVTKLKESLRIKIHENHYLHKPPLSVCSKGIDSIKGFFSSMAKSDKLHSNRIKIVMLGESGAGKTFLTHALVNCKACETETNDSTIGVEMHHCPFGEDGLEACIVDCAGQRRYQLTHPFFLSEEALHVIVVNLKTYDTSDSQSFERHVEDWINWVTARLTKPRIMVVATHRDELTDAKVIEKCNDILTKIQKHEEKEIKQLDREIKQAEKKSSLQEDREGARLKAGNLRWLRNNRPFISSKVLLGDDSKKEKGKGQQAYLNLVAVSSTEELKGMILLRNEICRVARCKTSSTSEKEDALFPLVGIDLPTSWVNMEKAIRAYRENLKPPEVPCMTKEQFEKFAYEKAGLEGSEVGSSLNYLDSVGEIKYYDNIPKTQYSVFLDLPWLCKLVKLLFRHDYEEKDAIEFKDDYMDFGMERIKFDNHLQRLKDYGRLSLDLLRCFWQELQLSEDKFLKVISSLVVFGLACEIPFHLKEELFIPWFLHSELDSQTKQEYFPDVSEPDQLELKLRFCIVGYLPSGVFDRLCVRCYALGIDVLTWKNSMLICQGDIQIYLEVIESQITVTGRIKSDIKKLWVAILGIVKELRSLLSEWPRVSYNTYTLCPHCIKKKSKKPHHFDCKWWTGEKPTSTRCAVKKSEVIDVNQVVPPPELLKRGDAPILPVAVSSPLARELAQQIPDDWQKLGTFLGLSNQIINAIKSDHAGNVGNMAYAMLEKWKELKGKEATTLQLIEALKKCEREDLVKVVCDAQY